MNGTVSSPPPAGDAPPTAPPTAPSPPTAPPTAPSPPTAPPTAPSPPTAPPTAPSPPTAPPTAPSPPTAPPTAPSPPTAPPTAPSPPTAPPTAAPPTAPPPTAASPTAAPPTAAPPTAPSPTAAPPTAPSPTAPSPTNSALYEQACAVLPGGVNSPVRAFGSVGGTPYFVARAQGAYVWDVEGNRYIDYVQSYGPGILGHAPDAVVHAVAAAAADGTSFGAPTEAEVRLAAAMCARVRGLEMLRLVSSGTEAAMSAVRLARGATGRNKIIKFAGCYHGHSDSLLAAGGSGVANQGLSGCDGVTPGAVADTVVAPYNVVPDVDDATAAVLVEPVAANMGLVAPAPGFLEGLRAACDRAGALLVFDEVITGFRLARGGATEFYGVRPDLWCFGKVIGGGLPVGAFGGSRDLMGHLAPLGGVYQAGTLSGNPLATAAGLATLEALDESAYERLEATAVKLAAGLEEAFRASGVAAVVPRVGSLLGLFFGAETPRNFDEAGASVASGRYAPFFGSMLRRGVALAPGPYEAVFVSLAHSDADIDATVAAAHRAAAELP